MFWIGTVEPWYNEPYNKVLEQFSLRPVIAKYMKKNLDICKKTSLQETNFVSPLALRYIEVLLNLDFLIVWIKLTMAISIPSVTITHPLWHLLAICLHCIWLPLTSLPNMLNQHFLLSGGTFATIFEGPDRLFICPDKAVWYPGWYSPGKKICFIAGSSCRPQS